MKKKKLILKKGVKKVIKNIIILTVLVISIIISIKLIKNSLNNMYNKCDKAKDHVCSYYEARNYQNSNNGL